MLPVIITALVSTLVGSITAMIIGGVQNAYMNKRTQKRVREERAAENAELVQTLTGLVDELRQTTAKDSKRIDGISIVVMHLARYHLQKDYDKFVLHDKYCSVEDKSAVDRLYKAYSALGGNGKGTLWEKAIMALPEVAPRV